MSDPSCASTTFAVNIRILASSIIRAKKLQNILYLNEKRTSGRGIS